MTTIKLINITILFFIVTKTYAQNAEYKNLREYVTENNLYDFGYGLEEHKSRLDSIVCFNDFLFPGIYFKELNKDLFFSSNDSTFTIVIGKKKEKILNLNILQGKKLIKKIILNDSLNDFSVVSKAYNFKFGNQKYSIIYLSNENNQQTLRSQYLAILIDNYNKSIIPFPRYQSTTSLLNITNFNGNQKLNIICYNPSFTGKVETFQLENKSWILLNEYTCNLKLFDGFVWMVDFDENNFLKKYYNNKAFR